MFCPKCGKQIPDSIRFCPECGATLGAAAPQPQETAPVTEEPAAAAPVQPAAAAPIPPAEAYQPAQQPQQSAYQQPQQPAYQQPQQPAYQQPAPKKKSKLPLILGLVGGGLLLLIILAVLAIIFLPKILFPMAEVDFEKYASATFDGYDTIGEAKAEYNRSGFLEEYEKKIRFDRGAKPDDYDGTAAEYLLDNFLFYYFDYDDSYDLSNGDKVSYHLNPSPAIPDYFNIKEEFAVSKTIPFTVSGLKEGDPFDPFEGLVINFTGMEPGGRAEMDTTNCIDFVRDGYMLELDKSSDLKNGDIVTVTLSSWYDNAYFLREYGKLPTRTSAEFTVEGLSHALSSLGEVSDTDDQAIRDATYNRARKWISDNLKSNQTFGDLIDYGRILVYPAEADGYDAGNTLYEIFRYKLTATSSGVTGEFTLFLVVKVSDLTVKDGVLSVDLSSPTVVKHSYSFKQGNWTVSGGYGYHTIEEVRNHLIPSSGSGNSYDESVFAF